MSSVRSRASAAGLPANDRVDVAASPPVLTRRLVSQHLKVLKDAGLVVDHPDGNRRIYQLDPDGVDALRAYLDTFWNQALRAFKMAAERPYKEDR